MGIVLDLLVALLALWLIPKFSDGCPLRNEASSTNVFDEQDFVAEFIVDHLIHQLFGHHDAEAAGPHPVSLTVLNMFDGIFGHVGDGGVRQVFRIEPGTWIAEIIDDCAPRADG
jgi:hypothetical protein